MFRKKDRWVKSESSKRLAFRTRNLQNLCVIPTNTPLIQSPNIYVIPFETPTQKQTVTPTSSLNQPNEKSEKIPETSYPHKSNRSKMATKVQKYHSKKAPIKPNSYKELNRFIKSRRKRIKPRRNRNHSLTSRLKESQINKASESSYNMRAAPNPKYQWVNPNITSKVTPKCTDKPEDMKNKEVDEDFEEVEVASYEVDVPVAFRKSKVQFLNYKKSGFFKPKIYRIGKESTVVHTIVNCTSAQPESAEDVVSEADYDCETENEEVITENEEVVTENEEVVTENEEVITEIEEGTTEIEEATTENDEVTTENEEIIIETDEVITEIIEIDSEPETTNETGKVSPKVQKDLPSDILEPNEKDKDFSVVKDPLLAELLDIADSHNSSNVELANPSEPIIDSSTKEISCDDVKLLHFKKSIEDNSELCQGESLVQKSLNSWKSHLIGSEYLIEIRNTDRDSILKYHCVLCTKDVVIQGFPSISVINHITAYNHFGKYLEKHFPASGFRFYESYKCDNIDILQKICEEINNMDGFHFMCITDIEQYTSSKDKMCQIVLDAAHTSEDSENVDMTVLKKMFDSILDKEVGCVINEIIDKMFAEEKEIEILETKVCSTKVGGKIESKANKPKIALPVKRNTAIASYLKLMYECSRPVKRKTSVPKTDAGKKTEEIVDGGSQSRSVAKNEKGKAINHTMKSESVSPKKKPLTAKVAGSPKPVSPSGIAYKKANDNVLKYVNTSKVSPKNKGVTKAAGNGVSKSVNAFAIPSTKKMTKKVESISKYATITAKKPIPKKASSVSKPVAATAVAPQKKTLIRMPGTVSKSVSYISPAIKTVTRKVDSSEFVVVKEPLTEIMEIVEESVEDNSSMPITESKSESPKKNQVKSSKSVSVVAAQRIVAKSKENAVVKPSLHSKHCPKRILGSGSPRTKEASKTSQHAKLSDAAHKISGKQNTGMNSSGGGGSVSKVEQDKRKSSTKEDKKDAHRISHKSRSPVRKVVISTEKSGNSNLTAKAHSKNPYFVVNIKKSKSESPEIEILKEITKELSTPSESSSRKHSKSPFTRIVRQLSRSPVRNVIKSPLRISPVRRRSRTPDRRRPRSPVKRHSRSPARRIRSPIKRRSRSPNKRCSRSPIRRRSRSPIRRRSRSPIRRRSRSSSRRRSRSPIRRRSRSPNRRHSRSPFRKRSRSPIRRRSRSPLRRYSRSPVRRYSRSPLRRSSRSPLRRSSRSPLRRSSRSPRRKLSPQRRFSKSPLRVLRSPLGRHTRSPVKRISVSPVTKYRNTFRPVSPGFEQSRNIREHSFEELEDLFREKSGRRNSSPSRKERDDNFLSFRNSLLGPDADLDPVSDEDESTYFNTLDILQNKNAENKGSTSKLMLELFKKFSTADVNPNDATLNKFMQFMETHSSEIRDMMGSHLETKSGKMPQSNVQENLLLQQFLLQSLAGKAQAPITQSNLPFANQQPIQHNMPFPSPASNFPQPPPFVPNQPPPSYGQTPPGMLTPEKQNIFPPNLNMPPPDNRFPQYQNPPQPQFQNPQFQTLPQFQNQPQFQNPQFHGQPPIPPPKPRVPPEIMFKDLKATVSKLFGPNTGVPVKSKKQSLPEFVADLDSQKWGASNTEASKFGMSISGLKNVFPDKNINLHSAPGPSSSRKEMVYNNPGQFSTKQDQARPGLPVPPPNAKVSFCELPSGPSKGNLFPVVSSASKINAPSAHSAVNDMKVSLAQRLASVLVKVGMIDVPAPLLQEMLMKIGAFSSSPPQDIREAEIVSILKRLGYL